MVVTTTAMNILLNMSPNQIETTINALSELLNQNDELQSRMGSLDKKILTVVWKKKRNTLYVNNVFYRLTNIKTSEEPNKKKSEQKDRRVNILVANEVYVKDISQLETIIQDALYHVSLLRKSAQGRGVARGLETKSLTIRMTELEGDLYALVDIA
jgi:hypothetical protein